MLSLIGAFFGFVSGFAPAILKFFQAKEDRKHELAVMDKQIEAQKVGSQLRLEEINVQADITQEQLAIQASRVEKSGVGWVDATLALFTGLVRPTITYSFFALYALMKWASYGLYMRATQDVKVAVMQIWTETDMAIFSTVVGFWFSGRLLQKFMKK